MPSLSVNVAHQLNEEQAARRLRDRYEAVKATYGDHIKDLEEEWDDTSLRCRFSTFGMKFQATVATVPGEVQVNFDVPLVAMMFKGTIEKRIREELDKVLA